MIATLIVSAVTRILLSATRGGRGAAHPKPTLSDPKAPSQTSEGTRDGPEVGLKEASGSLKGEIDMDIDAKPHTPSSTQTSTVDKN